MSICNICNLSEAVYRVQTNNENNEHLNVCELCMAHYDAFIDISLLEGNKQEEDIITKVKVD